LWSCTQSEGQSGWSFVFFSSFLTIPTWLTKRRMRGSGNESSAQQTSVAAIHLVARHPDVYEPCDDSFALADALLADKSSLLKQRPNVCMEIGCGSGYVITSLALILGDERNNAHFIATDISTVSRHQQFHATPGSGWVCFSFLLESSQEGFLSLLCFVWALDSPPGRAPPGDSHSLSIFCSCELLSGNRAGASLLCCRSQLDASSHLILQSKDLQFTFHKNQLTSSTLLDGWHACAWDFQLWGRNDAPPQLDLTYLVLRPRINLLHV